MSTRDQAGPGERRCGFVALIGAPNAGKSTLLNTLVGAKVAAVTHKVQTTRFRIRAVALEGQSQIIFVDTPGIFVPRRRLDEAMVEAAWSGAADADAVAVLVDARQWEKPESLALLSRIEGLARKPVLVINKIDLVSRTALLEISAALNERAGFTRTFMVSALSGDGVADLKQTFARAVPRGPWLYPEDQIADIPMRQMASEITREKLYLRLHEELPYASTVETESWTRRKDGSVRIEQVIFVERDSQKKIVIGRNGQTIKAIGAQARAEISTAIGAAVHLFLFVKVRRGWGDDPERFRAMGLDYPKA